jgi:hypothetical protein
MDAGLMTARLPGLRAFVDVRRDIDPGGLFVNPYLERYFA